MEGDDIFIRNTVFPRNTIDLLDRKSIFNNTNPISNHAAGSGNPNKNVGQIVVVDENDSVSPLIVNEEPNSEEDQKIFNYYD